MAQQLKVGEAHNTGLWWDSQAEKVVTSAPAEGRQIIAPGVEATNAEVAMLNHFTAPADTEVATITTGKETATRKGV